MALALFFLGGMAIAVGTEAVLPAYLVGMVLAPSFQKDPELGHRLQVVAFSILTPFYFLKAGSLVDFRAVLPKFLATPQPAAGTHLILILLPPKGRRRTCYDATG